MPDRIVEIRQMMPATGWFFDGQPGEKPREEYEPVAAFVMVATTDDETPTLGNDLSIIPLRAFDLVGLNGLIGRHIEELDTDITYETQLVTLDD
ncbi:hypothetical protein J2X65_005257 [Ancylobacter sp. 3268]|uniref:hypothetical protein n=1 Tax=Ancylobacter sp. 3268 TaxID=2817752 RepID=UPI0028601F60|nr:hypothetical protein [Ancylobacter sp. 3268]MDR6955874.1 hypothetical protein [Ancylobacter sp. 3268]